MQTCCQVDMMSCRHVVTQTCVHVDMLSCRHVFMQTCCHVDMLSCRHIVMQTLCHVDMLSRRHVVMQTCCHVDILSCRHDVMQTCCHVDMLSCRHVVMQIVDMLSCRHMFAQLLYRLSCRLQTCCHVDICWHSYYIGCHVGCRHVVMQTYVGTVVIQAGMQIVDMLSYTVDIYSAQLLYRLSCRLQTCCHVGICWHRYYTGCLADCKHVVILSCSHLDMSSYRVLRTKCHVGMGTLNSYCI